MIYKLDRSYYVYWNFMKFDDLLNEIYLFNSIYTEVVLKDFDPRIECFWFVVPNYFKYIVDMKLSECVESARMSAVNTATACLWQTDHEGAKEPLLNRNCQPFCIPTHPFIHLKPTSIIHIYYSNILIPIFFQFESLNT